MRQRQQPADQGIRAGLGNTDIFTGFRGNVGECDPLIAVSIHIICEIKVRGPAGSQNHCAPTLIPLGLLLQKQAVVIHQNESIPIREIVTTQIDLQNAIRPPQGKSVCNFKGRHTLGIGDPFIDIATIIFELGRGICSFKTVVGKRRIYCVLRI